MYIYQASNYSMGHATKTIRFEAGGDEAARLIAEKRLPGRNAVLDAGRKGSVIGLKKVG